MNVLLLFYMAVFKASGQTDQVFVNSRKTVVFLNNI